MYIKYCSEKLKDELKASVQRNLSVYFGEMSWEEVPDLELNSRIRDTRIEIDEYPELTAPEDEGRQSVYDAENAIKIYSSFKKLTVTQAIDERLWAYLTHFQYRDYMLKRWSITGNDPKAVVIDRYFLYGKGSSALSRNGLARLWWSAYLTCDTGRDDPFELTYVLFKNQDIQVGLLERNFGKNQNILHSMLDYIKDNEIKLDGLSKAAQKMNKAINTLGGVKLLDTLSKNQFYAYLDDVFAV